ncbi:MAG: hypothetical protein Q7R67_02815 [bacterium]|nr:hypothetical protein [bacterium]
MNYRILVTVLVFLSIIFLPYWFYVPALILAMGFFPLFWEGVLLGFLIDVLYGQGIYAGFLSLIGLLMLLPLRERIRTHSSNTSL